MKKAKAKRPTKTENDDATLREYLLEHYGPEVVMADGLSRAFVCVAKAGQNYCAVYDSNKVLAILRKRDKMDYDEAWEYFCFNVLGAYVGENTPIFVNPGEANDVWPKTIHGRV